MKTDALFYRLFQSLPGLFFELIHHSPDEADDYQFSSVEVKQLAFRIDGVFLPKTDTSDHPIYFVEVQFQPDQQLFARFFAETFLYLSRTELPNDWQGVIIFPDKGTDVARTQRYQELFDSDRVKRIYLDELKATTKQSLGIRTILLITAPEEKAGLQAKELVAEARVRMIDVTQAKALMELIETIVIYKFPHKSREEVETMLGLAELKQTRVYQEAKEEGKLESVPDLLALGLSVEQVAQALKLSVEQVRKAASSEGGESH